MSLVDTCECSCGMCNNVFICMPVICAQLHGTSCLALLGLSCRSCYSALHHSVLCTWLHTHPVWLAPSYQVHDFGCVCPMCACPGLTPNPAGRDRSWWCSVDDCWARHHPQRDACGGKGRQAVGLPIVDQFAQEGQDDKAQVRTAGCVCCHVSC